MTATQQNFVARQQSGASDEVRRLFVPQGRPQPAVRHEMIMHRGAVAENVLVLPDNEGPRLYAPGHSRHRSHLGL